MKSAEGEVKAAVLGNSPGAEEYLQHLNAFSRMLARKKLADDLQKCAKAVVTATVRSEKRPQRRHKDSPYLSPQKESS
jgi:hypothetical protein